MIGVVVALSGLVLSWGYTANRVPGWRLRTHLAWAVLASLGAAVLGQIAYQVAHTAPRWEGVGLFSIVWLLVVRELVRQSFASDPSEARHRPSEASSGASRFPRVEGRSFFPTQTRAGAHRSGKTVAPALAVRGPYETPSIHALDLKAKGAGSYTDAPLSDHRTGPGDANSGGS